MASAEGQTSATTEDVAPQPYSPRRLFWLKVLVYGLAGLICLSFVGVIAGVLHVQREIAARKANAIEEPVQQQQRAAEDEAPVFSGPSSSPESDITLPAGAQIQSMALSETMISVRYRDASGEGIVIYDIRTGTLKRRFRIAYQRR